MSLGQIEHVVVIVQENHPFDQYFGTLNGVRGLADPGGRFAQQGTCGKTWYPFHITSNDDNSGGNASPAGTISTFRGFAHDWASQHMAWNHGGMDAWVVAQYPNCLGFLMENNIPFHFWLAKNFTVCDNYFCSVMGPTLPNRFYLMSGSVGSGARTVRGNSVMKGGEFSYYCGDDIPPQPEAAFQIDWTNYPQILTEAGLGNQWTIYQQDTNDDFSTFSLDVARYFPGWQPSASQYKASSRAQTDFVDYFLRDVQNGCLPKVSWLVSPWSYSEHPDCEEAGSGHLNFVAGGWWLYSRLQPIFSRPALWEKTAILIVYDENDGAFDHVKPPVSPPGTPGEWDAGQQPVGPGFRVPALVVSPWTVGGRVCSDYLDHSSVIRFLERITGVECPHISAYRRAFMGDFTGAFDFSCTRAAPDCAEPPLPPLECPSGWPGPASNMAPSIQLTTQKLVQVPLAPFNLPAVLPPALLHDGEGWRAAWKGPPGDATLNQSLLRGDSTAWDTRQALLPGRSSTGVALGLSGAEVVAAWKGESTDTALFSARLSGGAWHSLPLLPGRSCVGPALCGWGDSTVYAAWMPAAEAGGQDDATLCLARLDPATNGWRMLGPVPGARTSAAPSLAVVNGTLWIGWKGPHTDQRLYVASYQGDPGRYDPERWRQAPNALAGLRSSMGPSLCGFKDRLFVACKGAVTDMDEFFRGEHSDQRLYVTSLTAQGGWAPPSCLPGESSITPALASDGRRLYACWKGGIPCDTGIPDCRLYVASSADGIAWQALGNLPGQTGPDWE